MFLFFVDGSRPGLFYVNNIGWFGIAGNNSGLDWFAARDLCREMKGELATVNDAETHAAVVEFVSRHGKQCTDYPIKLTHVLCFG